MTTTTEEEIRRNTKELRQLKDQMHSSGPATNREKGSEIGI